MKRLPKSLVFFTLTVICFSDSRFVWSEKIIHLYYQGYYANFFKSCLFPFCMHFENDLSENASLFLFKIRLIYTIPAGKSQPAFVCFVIMGQKSVTSHSVLRFEKCTIASRGYINFWRMDSPQRGLW